MTTGQSYAGMSRAYLAQADQELARNDLGQASEKAWGAVATIVKAVASQRGWNHWSHSSLYYVVDRLVDELQDDLLKDLFLGAGSLHTNFYEGWLERTNVESGVRQAARFVARLEDCCSRTGSGPVPPRLRGPGTGA